MTAAPDPNFAVGVLVALVIDLVYPVVHVVSAAGFVVRSLAYIFFSHFLENRNSNDFR